MFIEVKTVEEYNDVRVLTASKMIININNITTIERINKKRKMKYEDEDVDVNEITFLDGKQIKIIGEIKCCNGGMVIGDSTIAEK